MEKKNMNLNSLNYDNMVIAQTMVQKKARHGSKRRLVLLIILLICTLSLLGSATYAWFTANKIVRIEDMQVKVEVANGLEISSDAKTWNQVMTLSDLKVAAGLELDDAAGEASDSEDAGAINYFPEFLHNVSSIGNIGQYHKTNATTKNNRLELFTGAASSACDVPDPADPSNVLTVGIKSEFYETGTYTLADCIIGEYFYLDDSTGEMVGDGIQHSVSTALVDSRAYVESDDSCQGKGEGEGKCGENVSIIAFDMYLKLDEPSNIKLAQGSQVSSKTDNGLKNTIRVAFVTLGTQPYDYYYADADKIDGDGKVQGANTTEGDIGTINKAYEDVFGGYAGKYGARTMNAFGSISIWEPNKNDHKEGAILNASNNYHIDGITQTSEVVTEGIWADFTDTTTNPDLDGALPLALYLANNTENGAAFAPQKAVTNYASEKVTTYGTDYHPYKNNINYFKTNTGKIEETGSQFIFAAPKGVTKVRVYVWIEGNDIDTENNAQLSDVTVSLLFTSALKEGESSPALANYETYDVNNSRSAASYKWRNAPTVTTETKTPTAGTYTA